MMREGHLFREALAAEGLLSMFKLLPRLRDGPYLSPPTRYIQYIHEIVLRDIHVHIHIPLSSSALRIYQLHCVLHICLCALPEHRLHWCAGSEP